MVELVPLFKKKTTGLCLDGEKEFCFSEEWNSKGNVGLIFLFKTTNVPITTKSE
jgi:hypothetical protein